jgi:hypothetical protein
MSLITTSLVGLVTRREAAWLATAMLAGVTERLKFLVAFRPGQVSPTSALTA